MVKKIVVTKKVYRKSILSKEQYDFHITLCCLLKKVFPYAGKKNLVAISIVIARELSNSIRIPSAIELNRFKCMMPTKFYEECHRPTQLFAKAVLAFILCKIVDERRSGKNGFFGFQRTFFESFRSIINN